MPELGTLACLWEVDCFEVTTHPHPSYLTETAFTSISPEAVLYCPFVVKTRLAVT